MGSSVLGSSCSTILSLNSKVLTGCVQVSPRQSFRLAAPGIKSSLEQQQQQQGASSSRGEVTVGTTRRAAVVQLGSALLVFTELLGQNVGSAAAIGQNMLAGRIPGLSDAGDDGLRTYRRPDAKSGGHGVGWSPIIPYSFKVPTDWEEIPVSIADLGGTEIDLRFQSSSEGNISVVVAPVLRFSSQLGDNVKIEDVGVPQKVIDAFGPELTGETVEGKVKSMDVKNYGGRTYYQYELEIPHMLISATAAGNRLYLFSATGNGRQWKKFASNLKDIRDSFRVG